MNKSGMIITSLLYAILAIFILLLFFIVLSVNIRSTLSSSVSKKIEEEIDFIPPMISGTNVVKVFSGQTYSAANYEAGLTAWDNVDGDVTSSIVCTKPAAVISCTASDKRGNISAPFTRTEVTALTEIKYSCVNTVQIFTPMNTGTYQIELWGAQGGSTRFSTGGKGSYTVGQVRLTEGQNLYVYVGCTSSGSTGGYNGGGNGSGTNKPGGGGATDVRITNGVWNNIVSLRSRIMVAAGGGGATSNLASAHANGGAGGILSGYNGIKVGAGSLTTPTGGGTTAGGAGSVGLGTGTAGTFGTGGNAGTNGAGGGGGYYGGGGSSYAAGETYTSGAGGSTFISGYAGCNSVNENGTHSGSPNHFSGLVFTSTFIYDGTSSVMPNYPSGYKTGNSYGGLALIKFISN